MPARISASGLRRPGWATRAASSSARVADARHGGEGRPAGSARASGRSSAREVIRRVAVPGPRGRLARWRAASASSAAPAAATFSDSAPGRLRDRHAHAPRARPRALERGRQPRALARRGPAPSGRVRSASQGGTPPRGDGRDHREALAGGEVGRGDVPRAPGSRRWSPSPPARRAEWKASAEPGPRASQSAPRAADVRTQRAHVARVGDAGQVHAQRRREAHVAEAARGRLGQDGDDARRRRRGR